MSVKEVCPLSVSHSQGGVAFVPASPTYGVWPLRVSVSVKAGWRLCMAFVSVSVKQRGHSSDEEAWLECRRE